MPDYTQLMYEAAERLYAEIGERHGYSGLCAGLSAVCRELGFDLDRWYFSRVHHDPLVEFANPFGSQQITFEEIVRGWDLMWFGHGTGSLRPIEYPYADVSRIFPTRWMGSVDIGYIERQVGSYLKSHKIRRGTSAYRDFVAKNSQEVVDKAFELAEARARDLASRLGEDVQKASPLLEKARAVVQRLEDEKILRSRLLRAAGLAGAELTDRELEHQVTSWHRAAVELEQVARETAEEARAATSPNIVRSAALEALQHSRDLLPFLGPRP